MNKRSVAALAITAAMALGACGSDAQQPLSKNGFLDKMVAACSTVQDGIHKLTPPTDINDAAKFAKSAAKLLTKLKSTLVGIVPPADFSKGLRKFKTIVDDEIDQLSALEKAAKAGDQDGVTKASNELDALSAKQTTIADDLGVEECAGSSSAGTATTLPGGTTLTPVEASTLPATSAAPLTLPATSAAPLTLPATLPPATLAPGTLPPQTAPPSPGGGLTVIDLTKAFVGPAGLTLVNTPTSSSQPFVDIVAGVPALASTISSLGVGVLNDGSGKTVATIVIGVTSDKTVAMPPEWDTLLCDPGAATDLITPSGITGITCDGTADSGISKVFSLTEGDLGFILATFGPAAPLTDLIDGFFAANGG